MKRSLIDILDFTPEELEQAKQNDFAIQNGSLMRRVMSHQIMTFSLQEDEDIK